MVMEAVFCAPRLEGGRSDVDHDRHLSLLWTQSELRSQRPAAACELPPPLIGCFVLVSIAISCAHDSKLLTMRPLPFPAAWNELPQSAIRISDGSTGNPFESSDEAFRSADGGRCDFVRYSGWSD